jgi:hypothetical protein
MDFSGTGYNPGSSVDLMFSWVSPSRSPITFTSFATSDGSGAWSGGVPGDCDSIGWTGPVVIDVTGTDALGASATTQVNATCAPAP